MSCLSVGYPLQTKKLENTQKPKCRVEKLIFGHTSTIYDSLQKNNIVPVLEY